MTSVTWDYTELASFYDKRADYSTAALDRLISKLGLTNGDLVADLGAGTGKLTTPLAKRGLRVNAVEPNDAMRRFGIKNTEGLPVQWSTGTGEETGLESASVKAAFFGSSFNVVDQGRTMKEVSRILSPRGYLVCMWNHRDLSDPIQTKIENAIKSVISNYSYGSRREDPTSVLDSSGLFEEVNQEHGTFAVQMSKVAVMDAWRSHATLARQAGKHFEEVLKRIEAALGGDESIEVPYTTRIWFTRLKPQSNS